MPKLTTDQIKFIDTYLKNSGVFYMDIRAELTDHIASGIEASGIDVDIQEYLPAIKQQIKRMNRHFERIALRRNLNAVMAEARKPGFWKVFAGLIATTEVLLYFTSADTALMTLMFVVLAPFLGVSFRPVVQGTGPVFSFRERYRLIDYSITAFCLGLLKLFAIYSGVYMHLIIAGYALIGSVCFAFYSATKLQKARYNVILS
ncbi:MAG: hypothetical protein ACOVRN_00030 [Flavobacterium sp.]